MIYDAQNREYELIGANQSFTLMKCLRSGDSIKVANQHYKQAGFNDGVSEQSEDKRGRVRSDNVDTRTTVKNCSSEYRQSYYGDKTKA